MTVAYSEGFSGLRDRLHGSGSQMLGLFVIVPRIEVVEAAAAAGFDLVVLDCEHGPFGVEALAPLIAAAHGAGIHAMVRVAANDEQQIGAVLDCGADGVLVPHVGSGEDARRVALASRYPPSGDRSVHLSVRAAGYGDKSDYLSTADRSVAMLAMVESADAHTRLDEILITDGIDGIFVGPMDLAASLGLAGSPSDPRVVAAASDIISRAQLAGKSTSIFASTPEAAQTWLAAGVRLVVLSVDAFLMRQGFQVAREAARPGASSAWPTMPSPLQQHERRVMSDTTAPRLTQAIAEYALGHLGPLSDEIIELSKRTLIDTVGVALAAREEPPVRILGQTLGDLPAGTSTIWTTGATTDAPTAALLNGTAGHALDFDDVTDIIYGHPSVVLWPAVFAAAEQEGSDGRALLEAFVVGFGVQVALASAMDVRTHYGAGWHSTATIGVIGAAAGVSRLMGLDQQQTRCAIGLAASMAGGSRQNFGTMTKPLHPGLAARDAVYAARLAANGFTADVDQLDSPLGYFSMFAPGADVDAALAQLSGTDALLTAGINVKKYPCCYNTHRTADAILDLAAQEGIDPADIRRVHVVLEPGGFDPLIHHRPLTGLQGKFSVEYVIAAALLDGNVTLSSFTDEAVQRPEAQELIGKVTWGTAPVPPVGPEQWDQAYSVVTVETDAGEHAFRTDVPRGDRRAPLSTADLEAKFTDCCDFSGAGWDAQALLADLWVIHGVDRVSGLKSLGKR